MFDKATDDKRGKIRFQLEKFYVQRNETNSKIEFLKLVVYRVLVSGCCDMICTVTYSAILLHLPYHANSDMMILLDLLVNLEFIMSVERQMILK